MLSFSRRVCQENKNVNLLQMNFYIIFSYETLMSMCETISRKPRLEHFYQFFFHRLLRSFICRIRKSYSLPLKLLLNANMSFQN